MLAKNGLKGDWAAQCVPGLARVLLSVDIALCIQPLVGGAPYECLELAPNRHFTSWGRPCFNVIKDSICQNKPPRGVGQTPVMILLLEL